MSNLPPSNRLEPRDFGRRLFMLSQSWRHDINERMRRFGLTDATWRPLLQLGQFGDGVRQTDLAAVLEIEGPSLVRLLDALERAGLLERHNDAGDRRTKTLRMTEAGTATYQRVSKEYDRAVRLLLEGITDADLQATARLFNTVERNIATADALRVSNPKETAPD
jgi:MarR family transcriptional regulator for hemolysin